MLSVTILHPSPEEFEDAFKLHACWLVVMTLMQTKGVIRIRLSIQLFHGC